MDNINNKIYSVCLEIVQDDGLFLKNFKPKYQTEELCMAAVKQNAYALQFVEKQTEEMCLEAVKRDGWTLQFVKNQTPKICIEAVKQDPYALNHVKKQTPEICMEAVKRDGEALEYVKEQTQEICLEAVKRDGMVLEFVKNQTEEICMEAIKQNGWALKYVEEQTPEICLEAVKQNEIALQFVENQTPEICLAAIKQNYLALSYIKDKELAQKFRNELVESKLFKETDTYRAFITDGVNCVSAYTSPNDNIERPATIVLETGSNAIRISFEDNIIKCNALDILKSLGDYRIVGNGHYATIKLDGLSDDEISELFADTIMKVDESVREHYDLSRDIPDKNVKNIDDMEL